MGRPNPLLHQPRLFWGALALGRGGGGWKLPAAHKSKTIHGIDMEFGRGLENRKLINLA